MTPTALPTAGTSPKYDKQKLEIFQSFNVGFGGGRRGSDHTKMGKGVTLSTEELVALREFLNGMDL